MREKISGPVGEGEGTAPVGGLKLKGTFDLIGETLGIFAKRWKTYIVIQLIPLLGAVLVGFLVLVFRGMMGVRERGAISETGGNIILVILGIMILGVVVVFFVFSVWAQFSLMLAVVRHEEQKKWKDFFRESKNIVWGLAAVALLVALVVIGGFFLLIVPAFIFGIWYGFSLWVYIEKGKGSGIVKALRESKRIVKGFFWSLVWRQWVFYFLLSVVMIPVLGVIMAFFAGIGAIPGINKEVAEVVMNIVQLPIQLVVTPISLIFAYLLYQAAKELKDRGIKKQKLATWVKVLVPVVILVMVVVPASLAVVAVKVLGGAREKARDNNRIDDLKKVEWALEIYKVQSGSYPDSLVELEELLDLDEEATDPLTGEEYEYRVLNEGEAFEICAKMQGREFKEPYCVNSQ